MQHSARLSSALICSTLVLVTCNVVALPDEATGRMVSIISGDALGVEMLIGDSRTAAVDSIRLADIEAPSTLTQDGKAAKEYAYNLLMNKTVYLDIDDSSSTGRNEWSQLICVVYLMDGDFRPVWPPVNRLLVDAEKARVSSDSGNEFDPSAWWAEPPSFLPGEKRNQLKAMQQGQRHQASQEIYPSRRGATTSRLAMGEDRKSSILDTSTAGRISIGYKNNFLLIKLMHD